MATADKIRRGIRQYETTRGRRMDPKLLEALLAAELNTEESRAERNREFALRKEESEYRRMAADEAAEASGKAQVGSSLLMGGMLLKDTKIGQAIGSGVGKVATGGMKAVKGIISPDKAVAGVTPTATPTTLDTGIGTAQAAGTGAASGALTAKGMTQMAVGSEIAHLAAAGEGALATGVAEGSIASGAGAELAYGAGSGVTTGGMTVGSMAMTGAGMAAGAGIGRLGANILFPGSSTAEDIGTIGGGAVAGWMMGASAGSVGGPIGAVIGAAVGVVVDLVSDASVICTELYYQGYLSAEVLFLDEVHGRNEIDGDTYAGYLKWAVPLVDLMQKSKLVTQIVRPFGVAWAHEMASRIDETRQGNLLGKFLMKVGVPICRMIGTRKEVCHA